jgi:hypothetical protein
MIDWKDCNQILPECNKPGLVWRDTHLYAWRGEYNVSRYRHTEDGPVWDCDIGTFSVKRVTYWAHLQPPDGKEQ